MYSDLLVAIPAPMHGATMPRVALRSLAGRPLLRRAIDTAAALVERRDQIVVLVDDDEVALFAERQGCRVADLPGYHGPEVSLADRIRGIAIDVEAHRGQPFKAVMLLRPDAPLVRLLDLTLAVDEVLINGSASVVSERIDASLLRAATCAVSFLVSSRATVAAGHLAAPGAVVAVIPAERTRKVQTPHDWWICERMLQRKRVVFVVIGYPAVGLGHVSRAVSIAHELIHHDVLFICPNGSELAAEQLAAQGLPVQMQGPPGLAQAVTALEPDVVINDILSTEAEYVERLKAAGAAVVNFEDLGTGAAAADLVVNAIFMETDVPANHRNGPAYFVIRDEFLTAPERTPRPEVVEVLVTFGGTDAVDSSSRIARLLLPIATERGIHFTFVTGPGYAHLDSLKQLLAGVPPTVATLATGTKRISEYMSRADIAFSSAGRTVFELAAMGVPAVIIAANDREETHTFACPDNGFTSLGRADVVSDSAIIDAFFQLVDSGEMRSELRNRMRKWDFTKGRERLLACLQPLLTREKSVVCA